MNIIHVALYTFKRRVKDKKTIIRMVVFPLLLILILGASLNILFSSKLYSSITIEVISQNNDAYNDFKNFINNDATFKKVVLIKKASNKTQSINTLIKDNENGCIEISNNFKIHTVYVPRLDYSETSFIKEIVTSYENSKNFKGNFTEGKEDFKEVALNLESKKPTKAIDYYSVTMLIMIMLYGSFYGVDLIDEDKDIEGRVEGLPINKSIYVMGKIIGSAFLIFVQAIVIILFSKYIYKVNWGNNLIGILLLIALFSFFAINLGTFITVIFKNEALTRYSLNVIVPFFTFVSGGYIRTDFLSNRISEISILSPSYAIQKLIFNNIYCYNLNYNFYYYELISLSLIMFVITLLLGRRKL